MKKKSFSIFWIVGIILLVNFLSKEFFFRIDTTENKEFTLSNATKNILKNLEDPITVTTYFTQDLPPQYSKTLSDFNDLLKEYNTRSKGMVNFELVNPGESTEKEQEAAQNGIQPLLINVREKNEVSQKKAFMGAVVKKGDQKEVLPFITPGGPMEYDLTTAIKKMTVKDKPFIGLIQGHGEATMQDIPQVISGLNILYNVENVDLKSAEIDPKYRSVVLLNPKDSLVESDFNKLDNYLNKGGQIVLAFNSVKGDFQAVQGTAVDLGINEWLSKKGLQVPNDFVLDANCGAISVQQNNGFFRFNSQVKFPYLPLVTNFGDHPIVKGLEQIIFQFPSPMSYTGSDALHFTPLVMTSSKSEIQSPPISFDVQKKWTTRDFTKGPQTIGGILEGDFGGNNQPGKLIVYTDGNFPIGRGQQRADSDNFSLLVNSVDYLSDDTGLIDLRTKGVSSRPIKMPEEDSITWIKWANFLIPMILVLLLGIFKFNRNRTKRLKRMQSWE